MRIGFDAKRLFLNSSGLGNYSRTLVASLLQSNPEHLYQLYTPKTGLASQTAFTESPSVNVITPSLPTNILKNWWRAKGVVSRMLEERTEVYHGLSNELPLGIEKTNIPSVVTIHDLIFLRYPEYYPAIDRRTYKIKTENALQHASVVVAISKQTALDIKEFFPEIDPKVSIIYQGCDKVFSADLDIQNLSRLKKQYAISKPYIISIGTIEKRKQQRLLVEAFGNSGLSKTHQLVLVGKHTSEVKNIEASIAKYNLQDDVKLLDNISFTDLPDLLKGASFSCFPSEYEGFGIPILESMTAGVPTLSSDASCLPEVGGGAVKYFESGNIDSLIQELKLLAENESLQANLKNAGKERATFFSNEKMASEYMNLYKSLT